MYLQSLATAFPPHSFTQAECLQLLTDSGAMAPLRQRSRDLLEKILSGDSGIATRQFCTPDISTLFQAGAGELHRHFETHAPHLAADALLTACERAGTTPSSIDALLVCTCTGYLCPGLSSHISERLGMRPNAFLQDLLGLGCGAALPLLETARGILSANPKATVATIAVEISSAAFYLNDDPGVLISLCLFGDGAAAALWRNEPTGDQFRFHGFQTIHQPAHREKIRFVNADGRLKNQLHRDVPSLAAEAVFQLFQNKSTPPDRLVAHTGGRDVILAIENRLPDHPLEETRAILHSHGNISSPSVLAALEHSLATHPSSKTIWLTAFGAGFSAHSAELTRD
jgi:alkylresorcinol/alkylpyrone synthase